MHEEKVKTVLDLMHELKEAWGEFFKAVEAETEFIARAEIVQKAITKLQLIFIHDNARQFIFIPQNEDGMSDEDLKSKSGPLRKWFVRIPAKNSQAARAAYDGVSWETGIGYNPWQYAQLVKLGYSEKTWEQFCEFYEYEE